MTEQEERAFWIKTVLGRFWPNASEPERQKVIKQGGFDTRPIEQLREATVSDVTYVWMRTEHERSQYFGNSVIDQIMRNSPNRDNWAFMDEYDSM